MKVAVYQSQGSQESSWYHRLAPALQDRGVDVIPFSRPNGAAMRLAAKCDGLMWRFISHGKNSHQVAKPFLGAVEQTCSTAVWPNWATRWHYDDKAAQSFLLDSIGAPIPKYHVCARRDAAVEWLKEADFPVVFKLSGGARARAVGLIRTLQEGIRVIDRLFYRGLSGRHDLDAVARGSDGTVISRIASLPMNLARETFHTIKYGRSHLYEPRIGIGLPLETRMAVLQEFLPANEWDFRVIIIDKHAFALRRFNRPSDFRASGSGLLDRNPQFIDPSLIELAWTVTETCGFQCMGYDILLAQDGTPRFTEMSYTFPDYFVAESPGHWDRNLEWHPGHSTAQELIAAMFFSELCAQSGSQAQTNVVKSIPIG
jgi:glutathione synthase/RimK-type ligase-like ATP-grasp enzyme